jgi:hypothetical protein
VPSVNLGSVVKKNYGYRERDETARSQFRARLTTVDAHRIVYVDEAGIDPRDDYPYGYCDIGQRFEALKSGQRGDRISWIAG